MKNDTVKIVAVGDIFLGEHPFTLNHGVTTVAKKEGCDFLFSKIKENLKGGDIVCGNLEGIISSKRENETGIKTAIFWGEPGCADAMKKAGFNCLFLANNHTAQHGVDALERTCRLLDKNEIKWTGFNPSVPDNPKPVIFNVRGIKVGLLAYCETQQYHLDTPILPLINIINIKNDIKSLKKECDVIIISLHWGDEFIEFPSPKQTEIAHKIIDSGANLILGHHSHTMQGIEHYNNGLIVYSLGTFIKDLWRKALRESVILKCEISTNGICQMDIVPIFINEKYQPEVYKGKGSEEFKNHLKNLDDKIETNKLLDPDQLQKEYILKVKRLEHEDKFDNLKHYVKNMFRYDKKLLLENIFLIIKRRLYRKNI